MLLNESNEGNVFSSPSICQFVVIDQMTVVISLTNQDNYEKLGFSLKSIIFLNAVTCLFLHTYNVLRLKVRAPPRLLRDCIRIMVYPH